MGIDPVFQAGNIDEVATAREVPVGTFKATCLALLDEVAATGEPIVVTKRGRPVARLVPMPSSGSDSVLGSVTLLADGDEDYFSTGVWSQVAEDESPSTPASSCGGRPVSLGFPTLEPGDLAPPLSSETVADLLGQ